MSVLAPTPLRPLPITGPEPDRPAGRRPWSGRALLVLVGYAVLRVVAVAGAAPRPYNDSAAYVEVAGEPLLSRAFLAGERSWTAPLLYKALPASDGWRVAGAVTLSVLCWCAFALVVASFVRSRPLRMVAMLGILAFSLTDPVVQWDPLLLTESISISLTVLVIAAGLVVARSPSTRAVALAAPIALLWIFVRDTHAYLALVTCGLALLGLWRARPPRPVPVVALLAIVAAAAAASLASASTDEARTLRVETPLLHVIGGRIIPDDEASAWFHQQGMPLNAEIRAVAPDLGFAAAPEPTERTEPLYRWVREEGRSTYMRYLLERPAASSQEVATRADDVLLLRRVERYRAEGARTVVPPPVEALLLHPLGLLAGTLLAIATAGSLRHRPHLSPPLVGGALVVLAVQLPYAALVVHGDTIELGRHSVEIALAVRLGIGLLALAAADALLLGSGDRSPRARAVPAPPVR